MRWDGKTMHNYAKCHCAFLGILSNFGAGNSLAYCQIEQAIVCPSPQNALEGHTISRRSAADGGADAPSTHHEDGERTASTLINASHQLSGGCRAVVRAECTAARAAGKVVRQPRQQEQQVHQEAAGRRARIGRWSARRQRFLPDAFW